MLSKQKFKVLLHGINIVVLSYILLFITSILALLITNNIDFDSIFPETNKYIFLYTQIAIPMIVSLFLCPILIEKCVHKNSLKKLGIKLSKDNKEIKIIIYAVCSIVYISLFFLKDVKDVDVILLSIYVFVQCAGEEILFRSVLQRRLHIVLKPITSILLSTFIFIFIFHEDTFLNNLLFRTPMGILLSLIYYKTKSIVPTSITHFVYNMFYTI
ncbi:CPBP family intramembrane metalloprotease [Staphylococcus epidermidis]|nr:CPBP family intramembrane metalloprotease [Staphylococcus epidermidis]